MTFSDHDSARYGQNGGDRRIEIHGSRRLSFTQLLLLGYCFTVIADQFQSHKDVRMHGLMPTQFDPVTDQWFHRDRLRHLPSREACYRSTNRTGVLV